MPGPPAAASLLVSYPDTHSDSDSSVDSQSMWPSCCLNSVRFRTWYSSAIANDCSKTAAIATGIDTSVDEAASGSVASLEVGWNSQRGRP